MEWNTRFTFTSRLFSRRFYPKRLDISVFVRRKNLQYIAVGTVRMFLDVKHTISLYIKCKDAHSYNLVFML